MKVWKSESVTLGEFATFFTGWTLINNISNREKVRIWKSERVKLWKCEEMCILDILDILDIHVEAFSTSHTIKNVWLITLQSGNNAKLPWICNISHSLWSLSWPASGYPVFQLIMQIFICKYLNQKWRNTDNSAV